MGKEIAIRAFARLADVSPAAIRKGIASGRVEEGERGINPESGTNAFFLESCWQKKVMAMEVEEHVRPRWAAMCVAFSGRGPKPIFFYPPHGESRVLATDDFFDDWRFDPGAWTAHDPQGKVHRLTLVTCPGAPPLWLSPETLEHGRARKAPAGRQAAKARKGARA